MNDIDLFKLHDLIDDYGVGEVFEEIAAYVNGKQEQQPEVAKETAR